MTATECWVQSTGRIQFEVLTTLPILSSWIKKFLGQQSKIWDDSLVEKLFRQPSENLQHRWSNNLRKNLNKLHGSQYPVTQYSLFKFFLKLLDFLIQEKQNGNVVSTSHWIRPVQRGRAQTHNDFCPGMYTYTPRCRSNLIYGWQFVSIKVKFYVYNWKQTYQDK